MKPALRAICRARRVPLSLRRLLAKPFVHYSGEPFTLSIDGIEYRGHLDSALEWIVWVTGDFFEFTYLNLIRSLHLGGTAVDVGANVGNHTLAFAGMFDEVIAFEPYGPLFRRLEEKVAGMPNVRSYELGLGSRDGTMGFTPPRGRNTGTGRVDEAGGQLVRLVRGDDFLRDRTAAPIRFIKIDVEGYEGEVLRGLASTLSEHRPVVFYEAFRTGELPRAEALTSSFDLFPPEYEFWGLRGQTTFPIQRRVAKPIRITKTNRGRRYTYVLAAPRERRILE